MKPKRKYTKKQQPVSNDPAVQYNKLKTLVNNELKRIRQATRTHRKKYERIHWGHVGDLGHVLKNLKGVAAW